MKLCEAPGGLDHVAHPPELVGAPIDMIKERPGHAVVRENEGSTFPRLDHMGRGKSMAVEVLLKTQLESDSPDASMLPMAPEDKPLSLIFNEPVVVPIVRLKALDHSWLRKKIG